MSSLAAHGICNVETDVVYRAVGECSWVYSAAGFCVIDVGVT